MGDAAVCARLVEETVQHFGTIDILVNNAGIIRRSPAVDHSEEDWKAVIDVNLSSVFRLTQHAGRHMLAKGSGKIINIASLLTFQGGIWCRLMLRPKVAWDSSPRPSPTSGPPRAST